MTNSINFTPELKEQALYAVRMDFTQDPDLITSITDYYKNLSNPAVPNPNPEDFFDNFKNLQDLLDRWLVNVTEDNERQIIKHRIYRDLRQDIIPLISENETLTQDLQEVQAKKSQFISQSRQKLGQLSTNSTAWLSSIDTTSRTPNLTPHLTSIRANINNAITNFDSNNLAAFQILAGNIGTSIASIKSDINNTVFYPATPIPHGHRGTWRDHAAEARTAAATAFSKDLEDIENLLSDMEQVMQEKLNSGTNPPGTLANLESRAKTLGLYKTLYPNLGIDQIADREELFKEAIPENIPDISGLPYMFHLPRRNLAAGTSSGFNRQAGMSAEDYAAYYTWVLEYKESDKEVNAGQRDAINQNATHVVNNCIDFNAIVTAIGGTNANFLTAQKNARAVVEAYIGAPTWNGVNLPDPNYFLPLLAWHYGITENMTSRQRRERIIHHLTQEALARTKAMDKLKKPEDETTEKRKEFTSKIRSVFSRAGEARDSYLSSAAREVYEDVKSEYAEQDTKDLSKRADLTLAITNKVMEQRAKLMQEYLDSRSQNIAARLMRKLRSKSTYIAAGAVGLAAAATGTAALIPATAGIGKLIYGLCGGVGFSTLVRGLSRGKYWQQGDPVLAKRLTHASEFGANIKYENGEISFEMPEGKKLARRLKDANGLFSSAKESVYDRVKEIVNNNSTASPDEIILRSVQDLYSTNGIEAEFAKNIQGKHLGTRWFNIGLGATAAALTGGILTS